MKALSLLLMVVLGLQSFSQTKIDDRPIQNFYQSCNAVKFTAQNHMNGGIHDFRMRQYERAIDRFEKSLERDETLCDAYYLIGYSYQQMGDYHKSIEYCGKSIQMFSRNLSAYIIMAYSQLYLNNMEEAIKNFEMAKEIGPQKIDPYYGLALIKYHNNDYAGAVSEIKQYEKEKGGKIKKRDIKTLGFLQEKLRTAEYYSYNQE